MAEPTKPLQPITPLRMSGQLFEGFVLEILRRDLGIELGGSSVQGRPDMGFDVAAERGGEQLLIEVKLTTPQTSYRLEQMAAQLRAAADAHAQRFPGSHPRLVLVIPGVLAETKRVKALKMGLEVWDGPYLRAKARELGVEVPPGIELAEPADEAGRVFEHDLLRRLEAVRPGRQDWSAYEKFCEDLLNFLFVPPLGPAISQSTDERNANRRDYVLPNYTMGDGWWQYMRVTYSADYVVAEAKNLSDPPGKSEILQVANYLNRHGTGLFAVILARHGLDDTARWICREQWLQHDKLIIAVDDDDVRQMIRTRVAGEDPAELIRQKIETFRLRI
jgi:hypothetical protein